MLIIVLIKGLPFFSLKEKKALRLVISLRHNTSLFIASEIIVLKTIVQLHDDVTRKRNTCMCYCLDVWITESVNCYVSKFHVLLNNMQGNIDISF